MTIRKLLLTGAWLAMIAAGSGAAEFPTNRVYAFFSASPTLDARVKPAPGEAGIAQILRLRPNTEQSAYVYVFNPKDDDATVSVILSSSYDAGSEIARTAQPVTVPSKQVVKVALAGRAAPASPAKDKAGEKDPPPAGTRLKDQDKLYLRVEEKTDKPGRVEDRKDYEEFVIVVPSPVGGSAFTATPSVPKEGSIAVKVKFAKQADSPLFTDKPAKVRLDLRTDYNLSIDPASVGEGTFEAEVPVDGEATLYAEGIKLKDTAGKPSIVFVSVDGYDRAFAISTDFKDSPTVYKTPFLNVRLSALAQVPGKPVMVTVEADDESKDTVLSLDRIGNGSYETIRKYGKQPRQKAVYVSAGGEGDSIKLHPVVKDWAIEFATASVAGVRTFEVKNGDNKAYGRLLVDRTAPAKVAFVAPEKDKLLVGSEQLLNATGEDAESDIAAAYFHLGDAPAADGKPAPGSKVVKGTKRADGTWVAREPLRLPETKGDVKLGVLFVNGVGLTSAAEALAYVREPEKPKEEKEKAKKTTGSIEGVVMQSIRPQPDLPVTLRDAAGKELKKTKTDSSGKFEFKDLPPGEYVVASVKKADLNSNGSQAVTVEAGDKPAKAEITIRR